MKLNRGHVSLDACWRAWMRDCRQPLSVTLSSDHCSMGEERHCSSFCLYPSVRVRSTSIQFIQLSLVDFSLQVKRFFRISMLVAFHRLKGRKNILLSIFISEMASKERSDLSLKMNTDEFWRYLHGRFNDPYDRLRRGCGVILHNVNSAVQFCTFTSNQPHGAALWWRLRWTASQMRVITSQNHLFAHLHRKTSAIMRHSAIWLRS